MLGFPDQRPDRIRRWKRQAAKSVNNNGDIFLSQRIKYSQFYSLTDPDYEINFTYFSQVFSFNCHVLFILCELLEIMYKNEQRMHVK